MYEKSIELLNTAIADDIAAFQKDVFSMEFLNPVLLWGTLGVSVPIVIHLINLLRHRRVEWAAMEFLRARIPFGGFPWGSAGYPIASGVIEGACHHFVKDRMEGAGMRWELEGAQSMLSLRALYLNDQWDEFIAYRIAEEQRYLYGETPQSALAV